jgi:hypothetical protein
MASVQQPSHWWDFLPVWWSVIAGGVTALLGGILRVERIASGQAQNSRDIAKLAEDIKDLKEVPTHIASMDAKLDILLEDRKRG